MAIKTYKVTLTVTTASSPKDILDFIKRRVKDALPVLSLDYDVIEDRPTTTEHHGGVTDEGTDS